MCGKSFGNLLIPILAGALVTEESASFQSKQAFASFLVCPYCQTKLDVTFSWCPKCGQALRMQAKPQVCAYCGQIMTPGMRYCASCGGPAGKK